jgi:hypothetical protein
MSSSAKADDPVIAAFLQGTALAPGHQWNAQNFQMISGLPR